MKTLIVYYSKTGFTKRYAEWLAQALNCDCVRYEERGRVDVNAYDVLIFGSWCHAGRILKLNWLWKMQKKHPQKHYAVFAVGASPMASPDVKTAMEKNVPPESSVKGFYLQGGLNYEKMGFVSKTMMKMLCTSLKKKPNRTPQEEQTLNMISHSYDISDQALIEPIVEFVQQLKKA